MSYNIEKIKTINSTLSITGRNAKIILRDHIIPEISFLDDLDFTDPDFRPEDIFEIKNLKWQYMSSGNLFGDLKAILRNLCQGEGEFIIIWEDGEMSGLKVAGVGNNRQITEPEVKLSLV